jgi:hypothetical protein
MWLNIDICRDLLNDGFLMKKINLELFKSIIVKDTPAITNQKIHGLTPLSGFSCSFNDSIPYYDIIKFIGQFTVSQEVYDKCLNILESMPKNIKGYLLPPPKIMLLMSFNKNVDISKNQYIDYKTDMDNKYDFYASVYTPKPNQDPEYSRNHNEKQQYFYNKVLKKSNNASMVCLSQCFVTPTYLYISSIEDSIRRSTSIPFDNDIIMMIVKNINDICNTHIDDNIINEYNNSMIKKDIEKALSFIRNSILDESSIRTIFINACVYVDDSKYEK